MRRTILSANPVLLALGVLWMVAAVRAQAPSGQASPSPSALSAEKPPRPGVNPTIRAIYDSMLENRRAYEKEMLQQQLEAAKSQAARSEGDMETLGFLVMVGVFILMMASLVSDSPLYGRLFNVVQVVLPMCLLGGWVYLAVQEDKEWGIYAVVGSLLLLGLGVYSTITDVKRRARAFEPVRQLLAQENDLEGWELRIWARHKDGKTVRVAAERGFTLRFFDVEGQNVTEADPFEANSKPIFGRS